MVILGIDPGTANTGYGILRIDRNIKVAECGCIYTSADKEMSERLKIIYQRVSYLIKEYRPDEIALEQIYFSKNSKTALSVSQARGVIMLSASLAGKRVFDYTPLEVKQSVVGYGRAEKQQVQYMLKDLLHLTEIPSPDDTADALAVALCHYYSRKLKAYE